MKPLQKPQPLSTRDAVYAWLKEAIIKLDLPPGAILSENDMSAKLQVSRTPVRESFVRLAQEGLVQVLPQRGTVVSLIDLELVEEGRFMREQLERAVVRLACEHFPEEAYNQMEHNLNKQADSIASQNYYRMYELDEEYHRLLFAGVRRSMTWNAIQQMNTHLNRSRMLRLVDNHDWHPIFEQHTQILSAIRAQRADQAEQLMKDHLNLHVIDQSKLKEKYPDYYKS